MSLALLSFFLTWSFSFSIFPIWLSQFAGLNGENTGLIFSMNAIGALIIMPLYGLIQDKLGLKKHLLFIVAIMLIGSGPFFIFVYGPLLQSQFLLGAALGAIYFSITFSAGVGAVESYIERTSRYSGFEFGRARMWGSIGWAIATFMTGRLFNINPDINFWLASSCAIVFLIAISLIKPVDSKLLTDIDPMDSKVGYNDIIGLLYNKKFWSFTTYVMGVTCVYSVYDQQFPVYFASLFPTAAEGNEMFGYLNSLQVFLEASGMFIAPFIVNRVGAKNGLIIAGVIMSLRILGSGYAWDSLTISIMKLLHAAELPIMLIAIFKYIATTFDKRLSSTLYLVGFQFTTQVLASFLSVAVGMLYDSIGFPEAYKLLGIIVVVFVIISWFLLDNDKYPATQIDTQTSNTN